MVSLAFLLFTLGGALGIFLVGQLYVISGSYTLPMIVLVSIEAVGTVCFLLFGRYKYRLDGTAITRGEKRASREPARVDA